ncbi:MAG: MarC family protein [Thermodesulfobacteriota bacterium]
MSLFSATMLLFLVIDPFGNAPFFMCVLGETAPERRQRVIKRELVIALAVLVFFLFFGHYLLAVLHISEPSLSMAGGIILFLIAIRMIFGSLAKAFEGDPAGEPFIVPLAIPSVAGPSAVATELLLMAREPHRWPEWLLALLIAWIAAAIILLLSARLNRLLGERGLLALQRLMGLILTTIAVEMFVTGLQTVLHAPRS